MTREQVSRQSREARIAQPALSRRVKGGTAVEKIQAALRELRGGVKLTTVAEFNALRKTNNRKVSKHDRTKLEDAFIGAAKLGGLAIDKREYRFHETRKWPFDFAWPASKLAVEIEGGIWVNGGHNRGKKYTADCEKYNAAVLRGWRVLRYTTDDLKKRPLQVIDEVKEALRCG